MPASGPVAGSSPSELIAQLGEVWDALLEIGRALDDTEWHAPTPCPGWTVAAQYAHVIGTESMLAGLPSPEPISGAPHVRNPIGAFNEGWIESLAASPRPDVLERLASVTATRRKALLAMGDEDFDTVGPTPIGDAPYWRFMQIRVFDCWVHEQDVRDATGRPGHETGPAAAQALDEIVRSLGYVVGKKAGAPEGSSVRFALGGPLARVVDVEVSGGRAAVVDGSARKPSVTITLPSSTFARLACGRVAPEAAGVSYLGDAELGARVIANLAFTI